MAGSRQISIFFNRLSLFQFSFFDNSRRRSSLFLSFGCLFFQFSVSSLISMSPSDPRSSNLLLSPFLSVHPSLHSRHYSRHFSHYYYHYYYHYHYHYYNAIHWKDDSLTTTTAFPHVKFGYDLLRLSTSKSLLHLSWRNLKFLHTWNGSPTWSGNPGISLDGDGGMAS